MKNFALALSLALNVSLILFLLWSQRQCEVGVVDLIKLMARGDHRHLALHARSIAAIENPTDSQSQVTLTLLQKLVAAGESNHATHVLMGIEE